MTFLRFKFQDALDELSAFAELGKKFIAPESLGVLPRLRGELESYRNERSEREIDWKISDAAPLLTIAAKEYEPGGGGKRDIVAEITSKWQIKRERPEKLRQPAKYFTLVGIASTRVRLKYPATNDTPEQEIAMWRMEVADRQAPGCYFHAQILGQSDDLPFPKSIPIPRLPAIMMTPVAVAEFVLAELFQDAWGPHIAGLAAQLKRWTPIQQERFERLLHWKIAQLKQASGSPWSSLKAAKPPADLFV